MEVRGRVGDGYGGGGVEEGREVGAEWRQCGGFRLSMAGKLKVEKSGGRFGFRRRSGRFLAGSRSNDCNQLVSISLVCGPAQSSLKQSRVCNVRNEGWWSSQPDCGEAGQPCSSFETSLQKSHCIAK